jgi:hypothetical protein
MPYPEEAQGFMIDSPETWLSFQKRHVGESERWEKGLPAEC